MDESDKYEHDAIACVCGAQLIKNEGRIALPSRRLSLSRVAHLSKGVLLEGAASECRLLRLLLPLAREVRTAPEGGLLLLLRECRIGESGPERLCGGEDGSLLLLCCRRCSPLSRKATA
jgi:hypothetical protein